MLYIFYGPDSFSRREALQELKAALDTGGLLAVGSTELDGRQVTPQEVVAACDTAPFFSSQRLVIVEGVLQRLAGGRRGRRAGTQSGSALGPWQALVDYVDTLPPTTTLVLVDDEVPSGSPLLEALRGKGRVRHFRPPERRALPDWILHRAQALGLRMDRRAATLLADLVGSDLWALANELGKLSLYAGGQMVHEAEVRALVSAARDLEIWGLLDATVDGKSALALRLLRGLFAQGRDAGYVLTMLERQYRLLAVAHELLEAGATASVIGQRVGLAGYALERLLEQAARCPLSRVRMTFRRLLEADVAIKRGIYDAELALELLVQELTGVSSRST